MTCATQKTGLENLKKLIYDICAKKIKCHRVHRLFKDIDIFNAENYSNNITLLNERSKEICKICVNYKKDINNIKRSRLDRLLTSKSTGIPIMLILFTLLFWITTVGANYPSEWLSEFFIYIKYEIYELFSLLSVPDYITRIVLDGVYTTRTWVVAVLLPPTDILLHLFSLLEDSGYLPRIAFNLDKFFSRCGAHGKQSLTMAMGIGCNACGVTGCRIIESSQERIIAILTNNFMPCNGRFPTLIAVIMMFFTGSCFSFVSSIKVALILLLIIALCVIITLAISKILSITIAKGEPSSFALELPPYRKPQFLKTISRSFLDRTLFVLGRAVVVAAPAGAIIWILANVYVNDYALLSYCTEFLEPFGKFIGLDGVIVMAFILGFTANETVVPIIIMSYMASGTLVEYSSYKSLFDLFTLNGWTVTTAICMIIMCIMHFPCSTTCITIKKETGSTKLTLLSMLIPTVTGIILCGIVANLTKIF